MDQHPSPVVTTESPMGPLYTVEEVARFLRVSQRTVENWLYAGTLTGVRYGRVVRIRHADLIAFGEVLGARTPEQGADVSPRPDPAGAAQE